MKKFVTVGAFVACCLCTCLAAQVVRTVHPQRDVVIAEAVLAPCDSARLQSVIDAVEKQGGGTVFLAKGTYTIDAPVTVKRGVTLRGDFSSERPAESTVLSVVYGAGDELGTAAFSLEHGSGLVGLVFHYPHQTLTRPRPYPWTVRTSQTKAGNNQTIEDCVFVNSWRAIAIGPETNECHTFRRLRICALKTGFSVDMTTDIGRVYDVTVSPSVWAAWPEAPKAEAISARLRAAGSVAADYARSDWEFIRGLQIDGYHIGLRLRRGRQHVMNGVMTLSRITDCNVALYVDELNPIGFAIYRSAFAGASAALFCSDRFDSTLMLHSCRFEGGQIRLGKKGKVDLRACKDVPLIDTTAGGRLVRDDAAALTEVKYSAPAFARPVSNEVVFVQVDPKADDCTASIQSALDAAGHKLGGATVYLSAGIYRCRGTLTVPTGVEFRGASAVPHHTMSGGTVLFVCNGRGSEDGAPFCSLKPGAGLRGLSFWYPEQDLAEPVVYPWTIRSLGPGCWLTDVNVANAWQGVDFASAPSDGHRISYLSGACYRRGLRVGNAKGAGWIQDVQMNPHYVLRRPADIPLRGAAQPGSGEHPFILYQRDWLEGLVFENCVDERISGTFIYAAREGLAFRGRMNADVMIHGTDTGCRAFVMATEKGSQVRGALVQLVPIGRQVESAIVTTAENVGDLTLFASQFWPNRLILNRNGAGRVTLDQYNNAVW